MKKISFISRRIVQEHPAYHAKASKNTSRSAKASLQAINKATCTGTQLLHSTVEEASYQASFHSNRILQPGRVLVRQHSFPYARTVCVCRYTIPFSRCYFNYASPAARSGAVIVVSLGFFDQRLWSREISPILVSAVRAMSPLDDVFRYRGKKPKGCWSVWAARRRSAESFHHGFHAFFFESVRTDFALVVSFLHLFLGLS